MTKIKKILSKIKFLSIVIYFSELDKNDGKVMSGDSDKPSRLRAFTGVTIAIFLLINYSLIEK